jgi:hypothetical protein
VPGMVGMSSVEARAKWELEHGGIPVLSLNPCPFCGSKQSYDSPVGPRLAVVRGHISPFVIACACGGHGPSGNEPNIVAAGWNCRVP